MPQPEGVTSPDELFAKEQSLTEQAEREGQWQTIQASRKMVKDGKNWGWTLWEAKLPLPAESDRERVVVAKAGEPCRCGVRRMWLTRCCQPTTAGVSKSGGPSGICEVLALTGGACDPCGPDVHACRHLLYPCCIYCIDFGPRSRYRSLPNAPSYVLLMTM